MTRNDMAPGTERDVVRTRVLSRRPRGDVTSLETSDRTEITVGRKTEVSVSTDRG